MLQVQQCGQVQVVPSSGVLSDSHIGIGGRLPQLSEPGFALTKLNLLSRVRIYITGAARVA